MQVGVRQHRVFTVVWLSWIHPQLGGHGPIRWTFVQAETQQHVKTLSYKGTHLVRPQCPSSQAYYCSLAHASLTRFLCQPPFISFVPQRCPLSEYLLTFL